jgi:hypothetical protein
MKPIDIVIDVAKALQDWDGSPKQAGEKLLLACKAIQAYSPAGLDPSGASKYWHDKMLEALAEINRLNTLFAHGDEMALREAIRAAAILLRPDDPEERTASWEIDRVVWNKAHGRAALATSRPEPAKDREGK